MDNGNRMKLRGAAAAFLMAALMLGGCAEKPSDPPPAAESSTESIAESQVESVTESAAESSAESASSEKKKPGKPSKKPSPASSEEAPADEEFSGEEEPTIFDGMISMGWEAPTAEELSSTTWYTCKYPGDESVQADYFLELYGGETCENGDYDGEASLFWFYEGDEEHQEEYNGWWRIEEADGKVCLRLDLLCTSGALYQGDGQQISDLFPVLLEPGQENLILFRGVESETPLSFHEDEFEFEFLTRAFG